MRIVLMCSKCGLIRTPENGDHSCDVCKYCTTDMTKIEGSTYLSDWEKATDEDLPVIKERVFRKFLYKNPQFDEEAFEQRLKEEKTRSEEAKRKLASIPPSNTPKCPYCNSLYVEKITTGGRLISTAMFGFASGKIGKQWHCNGCKSNF